MLLSQLKDQLTKLSQSFYLFLGNALVLYILVNEMIVAPVYPESKIQAARHEAVALARAGEVQEAEERLEAILSLAPDNQLVWIDYLVILNWQGKHALALSKLHEVLLGTAPDYFFDAMIDSALIQGQPDVAQSLFVLKPRSIAENSQRILSALKDQGNRKQSEDFERWLSQSFPSEVQPLSNASVIAETIETEQERSSAEPNVPKGVDVTTASAPFTLVAATQSAEGREQDRPFNTPLKQSLVDQAKMAREKGVLTEAQQLYQFALADSPDDKQARLGLALVLAEQGDFKQSKVRLQEELARAPKDVQTLYAQIYLYQLKKDVKSELTAIAQLIKAHPNKTVVENWVPRLISLKSALGSHYVFDQINSVYAEIPQFKTLLYNKIALLEQQNKCDAVLNHVTDLFGDKAVPPYVFHAMLRCARLRKDYDRAEIIEVLALGAHPGEADFMIVSALLDVDQGEPERALKKLNSLSLNTKDFFNARAYAYAALPDATQQAIAYHDIVSRWPADQAAFVKWCLALSEAGGALTALEQAKTRWPQFSLKQQTRLKHNVAAYSIRRALRGHSDPLEAQQRNLEALKAVNSHMIWLNKRYAATAPVVMKARYDQIIAYERANKFAEVVERYQALQADGVTIPSYVRSSVARAYLGLNLPEMAQRLSDGVIAQTPEHYGAQNIRYYALLEQEHYEAAMQQSKSLRQTQPIWRVSNDNKIWRDNPARLLADRMATMHLAFDSDLAAAQASFTQKLMAGPANTDIRNDLATIYRFRGWPEAALAEINLIQQTEPTLLAANVNAGWAFQALRDYPSMSRKVGALKTVYPTEPSVGKLSEAWDRVNTLEFTSDVSQVKRKGDFFGGDIVRFDNQIFSSPLAYKYRLFANTHYADGEFPDKTQALVNGQYPTIAFDSHFLKVGLEYRYKRNTAVFGLINRDAAARPRGLYWRQAYRLNDHLRLQYWIESNSEEISLGSDYWGIRRDNLAFAASYRFHEGRRFDLTVTLSHFSDADSARVGVPDIEENKRLGFTLKYKHRIFENARHIWSLTESFAWTDNEHADSTVYYSPIDLAELNLALQYDGVISRQHKRVFQHHLHLGFGPVIQGGRDEVTNDNGFPTKLSTQLYYEQRWQWEKKFTLFYGVHLPRSIYDGVAEFSPEFRLGFRGLFR